jgi:hypothetical protein
MFAEKIQLHVKLIHAFCDGLEYQVQFGDHCFLKVLERDRAGFLRLAENCITQEHWLNSSRAALPTMLEKSTSNAVFYRWSYVTGKS